MESIRRGRVAAEELLTGFELDRRVVSQDGGQLLSAVNRGGDVELSTAVGHLALCSVVSDLDGVFEHLVLA